MKVFIYFK